MIYLMPYFTIFLISRVQSLLDFFCFFPSVFLSFPSFCCTPHLKRLLNLVALAANEASQICISMNVCAYVCAYEHPINLIWIWDSSIIYKVRCF